MGRRGWAVAGLVAIACSLAPTLASTAGLLYGDPLVTVAGIDLQTTTIPELQAGMASGVLTSRQLTQAYMDRIKYFDQGCVKVNAIRTLTDQALAQADAADAARRVGRT